MSESRSVEKQAVWGRSVTHAIGGLTAVGESRDGRHLLVLSWQGRGVLDLRSGECVARDSAEDYPINEAELTAVGIGPIASEHVPIAGLWGGDLPDSTPDGWSVSVKPDESLVLARGHSRMSLSSGAGEYRAAGFCCASGALIHATSADVTIYWPSTPENSVDGNSAVELELAPDGPPRGPQVK